MKILISKLHPIFIRQLFRDYLPKPELDRYENEGIDDEEQEIIDAETRRQAERAMDQQNRIMQRTTVRQAAAFMSDGEYSDVNVPNRRGQQQMIGGNFSDGGDFDLNGQNDLQDINDYGENRENLGQWLKKPEVVNFIRKKFSQFLRTFSDNGEHTYEARFTDMCQNNKKSIEVNFVHISNKLPQLAIWLAEEPATMIPILNDVAADTVAEIFPDYSKIHPEIFVRIRDLPVEDKLRDLRQLHLNALVKFRGVVTKRSGVFPQYYKMFIRCVCGDLKGPTYGTTLAEAKKAAGMCIRCQRYGPY